MLHLFKVPTCPMPRKRLIPSVLCSQDRVVEIACHMISLSAPIGRLTKSLAASGQGGEEALQLHIQQKAIHVHSYTSVVYALGTYFLFVSFEYRHIRTYGLI